MAFGQQSDKDAAAFQDLANKHGEVELSNPEPSFAGKKQKPITPTAPSASGAVNTTDVIAKSEFIDLVKNIKIYDLALQTINDHENDLLNGDIGVVDKIDVDAQTISVVFRNDESRSAPSRSILMGADKIKRLRIRTPLSSDEAKKYRDDLNAIQQSITPQNALNRGTDAAELNFIDSLLRKTDAELAVLSDRQVQWLNQLRAAKKKELASPTKSAAPFLSANNGIVAIQKQNGIVGLNPLHERVIRSEAPISAGSFLNDPDLTVRPAQYKGREVYGWMKKEPSGDRMLFCYDKAKSSLFFTDEELDTRESSVLKMLVQAENLFGDTGFELKGSDEFKQYVRDVADAHGIIIKDSAYLAQLAAPSMS